MKWARGCYVTLDVDRYKSIIALADCRTAVRLWLEAKRNYRESGATYGELADLIPKHRRNLERALEALAFSGEIRKEGRRYYPISLPKSAGGSAGDGRMTLRAKTPEVGESKVLADKGFPSLKEKKEEKKRNTSLKYDQSSLPPILAELSGFTEAWSGWLRYRSELRRPLTASTARLQLAFLERQKDPVAVIQQSIERGWQGLFELKTPQNRLGTVSDPNYWSGTIISAGLYDTASPSEGN